ncbi:hypothetical protein ALI22I_20110 [Saccharothrix sp. ALI-22-I]|uniref:FAD-binding protein n=1 Tax=Saccharothrix sp. ALI-22-I TaxID=1933778 RepID=UPI00097C99EB|nr:FAD-binding protein [Saccharothrix sp. ALI-22-I]ONI88049.1 hypothetical protein ALI22I_20110 [Saccharothrix sp. ALI-22-I]
MTDTAEHDATGHDQTAQDPGGDDPVEAIGWSSARGGGWTLADPARRIDPIPSLHGTLHTDGPRVDRASRDLGRIVYARPSAVLVPGDISDIARMVAYCQRHDIPVTARGTGHAMHGQALVHRGLVIDMTALRTIHAIDPTDSGGRVDADAGTSWSHVVATAAKHRLAFPCLTGYLDLTVGGTLSVGGISAAYGQGAQIDHVVRVQVVTGRGEIKWCDAEHNSELGQAVLGGLGQYGIITRVVLDLVPMPQRVRTIRLLYTDPATAVAAMTTLVDRGEADEVFCMIFPPGPDTTPAYTVIVAAFGAPDDLPAPSRLLRGLPDPAAPVESEDSDYLHHATQYTGPINDAREHAGWDDMVKPWFDVFLADDDVAGVVSRVIAAMEPADWSPAGGGFVLLFPILRDTLTGPQLRLPDPDRHRTDGRPIVFLFDVLDAHPPTDDPAYAQIKVARNALWWRDIVEPAGGRRYPIGVLDFGYDDWRRHYGQRWTRVEQLRHRHDPSGILATGQAVFGHHY